MKTQRRIFADRKATDTLANRGSLGFPFWLPSIGRDIVTALISRVDHCPSVAYYSPGWIIGAGLGDTHV
jgi:hypothetical protein